MGGFLSVAVAYQGMARTLTKLAGAPVHVVNTRMYEWFFLGRETGWETILRKLDRVVRAAAAESPTGKVCLVGHSMGGVFSRLYLSREPFRGRVYAGVDRVDQVISLGSPHYLRVGRFGGCRLCRFVQERCPDAHFGASVRYTSYAGRYVQGDRQGTPQARAAYAAYRTLGGSGELWGDGLVPTTAALLRGSRQGYLEGVSHHSVFGEPWYGDPTVVARWWGD
jgi:hypothetical protein